MKKVFIRFLAILIGVLPAFFIVFNSIFTDSNGSLAERMFTFVLVIVAYGVLGVVFGLVAPLASWRWGIWVSVPAALVVILYSIKETDGIFLNLFYIVIALTSGCVASYLGARLSRYNNKIY